MGMTNTTFICSKFVLGRYEINFVSAEIRIIICKLLTNENTGLYYNENKQIYYSYVCVCVRAYLSMCICVNIFMYPSMYFVQCFLNFKGHVVEIYSLTFPV